MRTTRELCVNDARVSSPRAFPADRQALPCDRLTANTSQVYSLDFPRRAVLSSGNFYGLTLFS